MRVRTIPARVFPGLILLLILAALSACATSPTGRDQLLIFSADDLDAMGVHAFSEMRTQLPEETDPAVNNYVRCIAKAITAQVTTKRDGWEVVVFKDESPNAFA